MDNSLYTLDEELIYESLVERINKYKTINLLDLLDSEEFNLKYISRAIQRLLRDGTLKQVWLEKEEG